jgi:hypothetical protein
VDWYRTLFEVIDMRSFSNLWYWIAIAVTWSTVSHWVLGVPFDMLQRARRKGGQADDDFETLVRINVNRLEYIRGISGVWLVVFGSMMLSTLAILGFAYQLEFAQAVFLIAFPLAIVALLSFRTAALIARHEDTGEALKRRMIRHRTATQAVGMAALFVTAFWGMWQNLRLASFGWF